MALIQPHQRRQLVRTIQRIRSNARLDAQELVRSATATIIDNSDTLNFVIDGGGATIGTGIKLDALIDADRTITGVTLLADQTGSVVLDLWVDDYASYPPTIADTIVASAKPTISSGVKSQDTTLTGWTKQLTRGQTLRVHVDSCSSIQRLTLALSTQRR